MLKYIKTKTDGFIIFEESIWHDQMANWFGSNLELLRTRKNPSKIFKI